MYLSFHILKIILPAFDALLCGWRILIIYSVIFLVLRTISWVRSATLKSNTPVTVFCFFSLYFKSFFVASLCLVCCCSVFMSDTKPQWRESGHVVVWVLRYCQISRVSVEQERWGRTRWPNSFHKWLYIAWRHSAADAFSFVFCFFSGYFIHTVLPAPHCTILFIEKHLVLCDVNHLI